MRRIEYLVLSTRDARGDWDGLPLVLVAEDKEFREYPFALRAAGGRDPSAWFEGLVGVRGVGWTYKEWLATLETVYPAWVDQFACEVGALGGGIVVQHRGVHSFPDDMTFGECVDALFDTMIRQHPRIASATARHMLKNAVVTAEIVARVEEGVEVVVGDEVFAFDIVVDATSIAAFQIVGSDVIRPEYRERVQRFERAQQIGLLTRDRSFFVLDDKLVEIDYDLRFELNRVAHVVELTDTRQRDFLVAMIRRLRD